ncbi:hypothetical protein ASPACDRAFT_122439 [Aspergillus aculeatus ATCC 16872]|uniref:Secreted protein CSS2 C-terminal domain-containing protein n=1 Tax=Aspergillus aculeatus (strain ATCC 16872 / CBS 172.66 / WB 5094) TaxID=690307 RepID=A0A1L9WRD8_ASPA1|nr:uncharacterized protein ASPACDRAFT_122439 [Aspergillus aculeatus ATCC 16872]OJJ98577.1 hypothetical protein ASPACDRAFT_122439 [Aspergillus aculeatus ATCC 16872]
MVSPSTVLPRVLALGLVGSSLANNTTVTSYIESSDSSPGMNLTVSMDVVNADYAYLYDNITTIEDLTKRTGITTTAAAYTVAKVTSEVIITAASAITIYEYIAGVIKSKSDANSCTITYGVDSDGSHTEGYAYKASTTGSNCDTTAELKTIRSATEKCATTLSTMGAVRGCCTMTHGGTWEGHLRLSGDPTSYPVTTVTC